jgi:hypothetical protein
MANPNVTDIPQTGEVTRRISHISVVQASKVIAVLYAICGLCFAPFLLAGAFLGENVAGPFLLLLILVPVFYGVLAFVFTAVGTWLYNQIAERLGGVEVILTE